MIILDLPPQVEMQIIEIAKAKNMSANDYLVSMAKEIVAQQQQEPSLDEMYEVLGFRPLSSPPNAQVITDDYINELREQHGI